MELKKNLLMMRIVFVYVMVKEFRSDLMGWCVILCVIICYIMFSC